MKINGYTRTCGLIGNPVEHTMSPAIHNTLAEAMGENMVYVPFRVPENSVKEAVEGARALNLLGCNVTVPYKSAVLPYLTEIASLAEKIGAVNTLVRTDNGFKGYNTDMPGLYRAMISDGICVDGEQIVILGAGGVARAVAVMLAEKAEKIYILNRTVEKAAAIAGEVNGYAGREVAVPMSLFDYASLPEGRYLAIQARFFFCSALPQLLQLPAIVRFSALPFWRPALLPHVWFLPGQSHKPPVPPPSG